jgi:hypothetical protein
MLDTSCNGTASCSDCCRESLNVCLDAYNMLGLYGQPPEGLADKQQHAELLTCFGKHTNNFAMQVIPGAAAPTDVVNAVSPLMAPTGPASLTQIISTLSGGRIPSRIVCTGYAQGRVCNDPGG